MFFEEVLKLNEIVKYDNYMNELKLKEFTSNDLDFLITLCAKMRDMDTQEVIFDFAEIKAITNYKITSKERFVNDLERMNKKLMQVTCRLKAQDKILMFVLFPTFEINLENNTLIVAINEKFKFILNELVKGFTRFELAEFVELDSKYTKNLYRLLKQFRTTGKLIVDNIEDFREKLDCPAKYTQKYFYDDVLKTAVKELQEKEIFKNLVCEPVKAKKRGSPVVGYTFTFDSEQVPEKDQSKQDQVEAKASKEVTKKEIPKQKQSNRFNDFPQREYSKEDMNALEQRLLHKK